jgi:hypothetical protein
MIARMIPNIGNCQLIVKSAVSRGASTDDNLKMFQMGADTYRISHGLRCDMIFIQRVLCFLSPSLGEGIENTQRVG